MAHKGRRRSFAIVLLLFLTAVYILGWSSLFSVKAVHVIGAPTAAETKVIQESIVIGEKMARLEPRALNTTLATFAWLDHFSVRRNWISRTVTVEVFPRVPIAVVNGAFVDGQAHLFTLPGDSASALPTITASTQAARLFAVKLLMGLPANVRVGLLSIETQGERSARLLIREKSLGTAKTLTVVWGDLSNSPLKGRVYGALISLPENAKISLVDVSAPHAPIVR